MKRPQKFRDSKNEDGYEKRFREKDGGEFDFSEDSCRLFLDSTSIPFAITDRYCHCGRIRTMFTNKLSSNVDTKSAVHFYDADNLCRSVLQLDKGGSVYVTKKSLMLNQFLEYTADTTKTVKTDNDMNWFNSDIARNKDQYENNMNNFNMRTEGSEYRNHTSTMCLPFSTQLLDKRIVSLFKSVALYWFFCLNTVLTKGDIFKRKDFSTIGENYDKKLLTTSFSSELLNANATVSFVVRDSLIENLADDFLWSFILDSMRDNECLRNGICLLSFKEHSKMKLAEKIWRSSAFVFPLLSSSVPVQKLIYSMLNLIDLEVLVIDCASRLQKSNHGNGNRTTFLWNTADFNVPALCKISQRQSTPPYKNDEPELIAKDSAERVKRRMEKTDYVKAKYKDLSLSPEPGENIATSTVVTTIISPGLNGNRSDFSASFEKVEIEYNKNNDHDECNNPVNNKTNRKKNERVANVQFNSNSNSVFLHENYYFLPEGIFGFDEKEYPQYNLWCSPLIMDEVLSPNSSSLKPQSVKNIDDNLGNNFKPYRLWESSFVVEEDYISNVRPGENEFSVFSIPYCAKKPESKADEKCPDYNLWRSHNIIEFLPAVGCLRYLNNDFCSTNNSTSSSDSLNSVCDEEFFEIFETNRQHDGYIECGKFLSVKPIMSGLVSLTDRGAFKYYKKSIIKDSVETKIDSNVTFVCNKSVSFCAPGPAPLLPSVPVPVPVSLPISVSTSHQSLMKDDASDSEVNRINQTVHKLSKNEQANVVHIFKPIQPAFKVETDIAPPLERSLSGTYYHQNQKLHAFKHELDVCFRNHHTFQPKFVVSRNDKACQTEIFNCKPLTNSTNEMNFYYKSRSKKNQPQQSSNRSPGKEYFYHLEDVYNFFKQPGLANTDAKNEVALGYLFSD